MSEPARATPAGTKEYSEHFGGKTSIRHFSKWRGYSLGSIGIGTYLGPHDDTTDNAYETTITEAVKLGCNHIDTAINYRCMRSERAVGRALHGLFESDGARREEIFVATKGGYVPFEGNPPLNVRGWIQERYIDRGLLEQKDLACGSHALAPAFLEDQVGRSLENLQLNCIDLYYLHNPEVQAAEVLPEVFRSRMRDAFAALEAQVDAGRIGCYGVSSWDGFRVDPGGSPYIDIGLLVEIAREVTGDGHHFAAVQFPFNAAMMEAFTLNNHNAGDAKVSALGAASAYELLTITSAPLLQAKLFKSFPPFLLDGLAQFGSKAERAIQFVRSIPGVHSVLVGMSDPLHLAENMTVSHFDPLTEEELFALFG